MQWQKLLQGDEGFSLRSSLEAFNNQSEVMWVVRTVGDGDVSLAVIK